MNKVVFGLKNAHYAAITNEATPTFGVPVAFPGAVALSLSPKGESTDFYADDGLYHSSNKNNGYEGELEAADIPQSFLINHLGFALDDQNNLVERDDDKPVEFAFLFEIDGDEHARKVALFKCIASRPEVEAETKKKTAEPKTTKLKFIASPLKNVVKVNSTPTSLNSASWYTTVPFPDPVPSA